MGPFLWAAIIIGLLALLAALPDLMRWHRRRRRRSRHQRRPVRIRVAAASEDRPDPEAPPR